MKIHDVRTPALVVDLADLDHNIDVMAEARPGPALRPHVKAFKSTAIARHVAERAGHQSFCCATLREMEGLVDAGVEDDLLLANETLDELRLAQLVRRSRGRITVAVDSPETVAAAAPSGAEVLIDVDVGLPRCGCLPEDAGPLAELAASRGITVRGVMGYEGHTVGDPDRPRRSAAVDAAMALLRRSKDDVASVLDRGPDALLASVGGTGTYDLHDWADEVQAGSYLLMDTHYEQLGLPFRQALSVEVTVVSSSPAKGWGVVDAGLKAFGMDHGNPTLPGLEVFFCSDEHTTFTAGDRIERGAERAGSALPMVGERLRMLPAHIDPTIAYHEQYFVVDGDDVVDVWPIDLRGW
jgi:D-threonine aldolase